MAKLGGIAKGENGFKQKASRWVRENGFERAMAWVDGIDNGKEVPWPSRQFAMGLLFNYALGRPAEQIQIENKKELIINLSQDPLLNAIAERYNLGVARGEKTAGSVLGDGETSVPTTAATTDDI